MTQTAVHPLPEGWSPIHDKLSRLPSKLQLLLVEAHQAAHTLVRRRAHATRPSEVAFFCPVTAIARSLGVEHNTVATWFARYPVLQQVITYSACTDSIWDARTQRRKRWHAGAVWVVRFTPGRVHMRDEYLQHRWRDLQRDIKLGQTLRRSGTDPQRSVHDTIQHWTVVVPSTPLELDRRKETEPLEAIHAAHDGPSIDTAALILARVLHDPHINCWRRVLWRAHRQRRLHTLADLTARTLTDVREWPSLRSPAALLVKRSREAGLI